MSRRRPVVATLAVLVACGAVLVPHTISATAAGPGAAPSMPSGAIPRAEPPPRKAWLVGVVTDQAGHPLQDVNVEAWEGGPGQTAPVASDLTYENLVDGKQGYFRLEVPIHGYYHIVVSGDPDDPYRTFQYNDGAPITVGTHKVRKLGTSAIARVALQPSRTTATIEPGTVKAGRSARVTVTVSCQNVDPVLGTVTATVGGRKVAATLEQTSSGTVTMRLPKVKKAGRYAVEVRYLGDTYVSRSTPTRKLTLVVRDHSRGASR